MLPKVKIFALFPCRFFKVMDDFTSTCGEGEFALLQIYFKQKFLDSEIEVTSFHLPQSWIIMQRFALIASS